MVMQLVGAFFNTLSCVVFSATYGLWVMFILFRKASFIPPGSNAKTKKHIYEWGLVFSSAFFLKELLMSTIRDFYANVPIMWFESVWSWIVAFAIIYPVVVWRFKTSILSEE